MFGWLAALPRACGQSFEAIVLGKNFSSNFRTTLSARYT